MRVMRVLCWVGVVWVAGCAPESGPRDPTGGGKPESETIETLRSQLGAWRMESVSCGPSGAVLATATDVSRLLLITPHSIRSESRDPQGRFFVGHNYRITGVRKTGVMLEPSSFASSVAIGGRAQHPFLYIDTDTVGAHFQMENLAPDALLVAHGLSPRHCGRIPLYVKYRRVK